MHKQRWAIKNEDVPRIETMAGMGFSRDEIAAIMGVSHDTFERAIKKNAAARASLNAGRLKADLNVTNSAYEMAVDKKHPGMTRFWLMARRGWKTQQTPQVVQIHANEALPKTVSELDPDKLLSILSQVKLMPKKEVFDAKLLSLPIQVDAETNE